MDLIPHLEASYEQLMDGSTVYPSKTAYRVVIGLFTSLSVLSVFARAYIRLKTRSGRLFLDDYLLFCAAAFLAAAAGLFYSICDILYLFPAIQKGGDPTRLVSDMVADHAGGLEQQQKLDELGTSFNLKVILSLVAAWTAIFLVKFSFLAFFRQLTAQVYDVHRCYWVVVALTVLSWMTTVVEPFIMCPWFGMDAVKCLDPARNILSILMIALVNTLDILTDVLIITIPIIILRRARIQLKQKIALGIFLCLSVVMIGLALTRMSKIILPTVGSGAAVDNWWQFFWQFIEASVAVLMASLTAVRNLFVATSGRRSDNKGGGGNRPRSDPVSFRMRLRMRHRRLDSSEGSTNEKEGWEGDNLKLPRIPRATITGLRSYIDREGN